jgi:integrase/recombinase XerD
VFDQFIKERRYLGNVSERTIEWYRLAFLWLPNPNPSAAELKQMMVSMREKGLSARSINSYRTGINAYLHWISSPGTKCSPACPHPRMPKMKAEQKVLPVYSTGDVSVFAHWKPKSRCERRLQVMILMLVDTGCRISELIDVRWQDVNLDDLLVTVRGKGDKERTIPFSMELRKHLCKLQPQSK